MGKQKWFATLLVAVLCFLCCGVQAMAADQVGYIVEGNIASGNRFIATISIEGVEGSIGRFALDFDETKMQLSRANDFNRAIQRQAGVVVTQDNYDVSDLISNEDGYVMFAWYSQENTLDSRTEPKALVQLEFQLADGVTADDLDWDTLRLLDMSAAGNVNWRSGAFIGALDLTYYFYNLDNELFCDVTFDYPNDDARPANLRLITFDIKDGVGQALAASVLVNNRTVEADSNGKAETYLTDGTYSYRVSLNGYGTKYDKVTVDKVDKTEEVVLLTDQQLVDYVTEHLTISYIPGDSANAVTSIVGLPTTGQDSTEITWASSDSEVISNTGNVFPRATKTQVTLTATVKKNQASATRDFVLTVLSRGAISDIKQDKEDNENNANNGTATNGSSFSDLTSVPWAREAILALAEKGIIKGTTPTTFSPNDRITRADFMVLLVRMLSPNGEPEGNFADVTPDKYYYKEIAIAKQLGIAQGSGDNRFEPEASISRQDMMVLTSRALVYLQKIEGASVDETIFAEFVDKNQISDYAIESVGRMVEEGFIAGDESHKLNPLANTTRAETAVFLYRIYNKLN
ncbi:MAG: S-layer homology domain-containing protein [Peptococcaceae bacterium]|jgi:hypothetical protein|nr:S-layer homology domain-containing protein [Peptococcaceae bacterium]